MSQIADNRFPCVMLLGGLSVNLNHLKNGILVFILLHIYANLWLKIPKFGGSKKWATFWHLKNCHFMAQQMANWSRIQKSGSR